MATVDVDDDRKTRLSREVCSVAPPHAVQLLCAVHFELFFNWFVRPYDKLTRSKVP